MIRSVAEKVEYLQKNLNGIAGMMFPRPMQVTLAITAQCNSSCRMCEVIHRSYQGQLSTAEIESVIAQLHHWLGAFDLFITGGEPTLRPDVWRILKYASSLNIRTFLCTNGTNLPRSRESILDASVYRISISLDSVDPVTYRKIRGADHCARVIDNLMYLKEWGMRVGINTVVTRYNLTELPQLAGFARKHRLSSIFFLPVVSKSAAREGGGAREARIDLWPRAQEVNHAMEILIKCKERGYPIMNSAAHLRAIASYYSCPESINLKCEEHAQLRIDSDGSAGVCLERFGNVLATKPQEIWNSPRGKNTRRRVLRCRRHCAALKCQADDSLLSMIIKRHFYR